MVACVVVIVAAIEVRVGLAKVVVCCLVVLGMDVAELVC